MINNVVPFDVSDLTEREFILLSYFVIILNHLRKNGLCIYVGFCVSLILEEVKVLIFPNVLFPPLLILPCILGVATPYMCPDISDLVIILVYLFNGIAYDVAL